VGIGVGVIPGVGVGDSVGVGVGLGPLTTNLRGEISHPATTNRNVTMAIIHRNRVADGRGKKAIVEWMPGVLGLLPQGLRCFYAKWDNRRMRKTFILLQSTLLAGAVLLGSAVAQQSTTKSQAAPAKPQSTPAPAKTPDAPAPKPGAASPYTTQKD